MSPSGRSARGALTAAPRYAVGLLLIVVTLLVNVEVALRFVFNLPLDAISELVLLLFPWLTLLGAAVAITIEGSNVALHLFSGRVSPGWRKAIRALIGIAAATFGVFMIVQGLRYTDMTSGELSNVLEIPRSWEIGAFPVAGVLFIVYSVQMLLALRRADPRQAGKVAADTAR